LHDIIDQFRFGGTLVGRLSNFPGLSTIHFMTSQLFHLSEEDGEGEEEEEDDA